MSARRAPSILAAATCAALAAAAGVAAAPKPTPAPAHPDSVRSVVAIEFLESPPSGYVVTGGLLGVPDSSGRFPERYQRFDPVTGQMALPGRGAGDFLVFTDLKPGRYRVALLFLGESKLAKELLPKDKSLPEDRCLVYGDTLSRLTFTVADRQALYLGRLMRHTRPSLDDKNELWRSWIEWGPGDERKALQSLAKRKDMAPWKALLTERLAHLEKARGTTEAKR